MPKRVVPLTDVQVKNENPETKTTSWLTDTAWCFS